MQLLYVRDDFDFPVFSSFFNPRGLVARINRFDSIVNFFNTWCIFIGVLQTAIYDRGVT